MKTILRVGFLIILITITSGCRSDQQSEDKSFRTYYDSLSLNTPEEAINTFVHAYQQSDYVTVFMALAPEAQQEFADVSLFNLSANPITVNLTDEDQEELLDFWGRTNINSQEHNLDGSQFFTTMMLSAEKLGLLPLYFPGDITFLDTINSESTNNRPGVDVKTTIDALEQPLTFRMVQSPDGKWRVLQVIRSGSEEDNIPWERMPTTEHSPDPSTEVDNLHGGYDKLDLSSPGNAIQTFSHSFQNQDFPSVFWILHPNTQWEWFMNYRLLRFEKLVNDQENPVSIFWQTEVGQRIQALEETGKIDRNEGLFVILNIQGISESPNTPLVMEHVGDASYLFDQLMLASNGNYIVDFSRQLTILEIQAEESPEEITRVIVQLEGDDEMVFRMKQSPSGRWRVLDVVSPNGNEHLYPFNRVVDDSR